MSLTPALGVQTCYALVSIHDTIIRCRYILISSLKEKCKRTLLFISLQHVVLFYINARSCGCLPTLELRSDRSSEQFRTCAQMHFGTIIGDKKLRLLSSRIRIPVNFMHGSCFVITSSLECMGLVPSITSFISDYSLLSVVFLR